MKAANSEFNSLQIHSRKRFSHGLQFEGSYVWSKVIDEGSNNENSYNTRMTRSVARININRTEKVLTANDFSSLLLPNLSSVSLPSSAMIGRHRTPRSSHPSGPSNGWPRQRNRNTSP